MWSVAVACSAPGSRPIWFGLRSQLGAQRTSACRAQDHQLGLDRVRQVTMETDAPAAEVDGWRVGEASDEAPRLVLDTPLPRLTGGPGVLTRSLGRPGAGPEGFLLSHLPARKPLLLPGVKAQQVFGASDPAQGRRTPAF